MSFRLSLRARAALLSVIPGFLVLIFSVIIWVYVLEQASMDTVLKRDAEIARITSHRLSEALDHYAAPLQKIAANLMYKNVYDTRLHNAINHYDPGVKIFDCGIHLYDENGLHLESEFVGLHTKCGSPSLPAITLRTIKATLRPVYSNVVIIPKTNKEVFLLAVPVLDDESRLIGVLAGVFDLRHSFLELEYANALDIKAGRGGYSYLVDGNGVVIHHRKTSLIGKSLAGDPLVDTVRQGKVGAESYTDESGQKTISGYAPVPGTPWGLITRERWELIVAPILKYNRMLKWTGPAILLLTALIVYLAMGRALKPVWELSDGVKQIASGQFETVLSINTGDEIADLANQFNRMAGELRVSYSELNKRIDELHSLQGLLANIINAIPSGLIGVDAEERITHWNQKAEELSGIPADKVKGRLIGEVFPMFPSQLETIRKAMKESLPKEEARIPNPMTQKISFLDMAVYPLIGDGVDGAVIRVDDVTQKVRMEEIMIQSEKMLSIGGLAAGMAHEINNPLAGIIQSLQVMRRRVEEDLPGNIKAAEELGVSLEKVRAYLDKRGLTEMMEMVLTSGSRAARIVENMLSFSRKSKSQFSEQDMAELTDKTLDLAANEYNLKKSFDFRNIKIVRDYSRTLPRIWCEPNQIQQVLLNLFSNAAHAMMALDPPLENPALTVRLRADKAHLTIVVEDNGPGMDDDIRLRIFEPFFTTKPLGVGTGLGLSVSYFIVTKGHGGAMEVDSSLGKGTRFFVKLPISRQKQGTENQNTPDQSV